MSKKVTTQELADLVAELTKSVNGLCTTMNTAVDALSKRVTALENAKQAKPVNNAKAAKPLPKPKTTAKPLTKEQQAESDRIVVNNAVEVFHKYVGDRYTVKRMVGGEGDKHYDFYKVKITVLLGENFSAVNSAVKAMGGRYNPRYKNFVFDNNTMPEALMK